MDVGEVEEEDDEDSYKPNHSRMLRTRAASARTRASPVKKVTTSVRVLQRQVMYDASLVLSGYTS